MVKFTFNIILAIFALFSYLTLSLTFNHRSKRFLSFYRKNSAIVQWFCGIGIPVNLDLEAVTIGYSFKSNFVLPMNASDFWSFAQPFDALTTHDIGRSDNDDVNNEGSGYDDEQGERFERSIVDADIIESGTIQNNIEDNKQVNKFATTRWLVYKGLAEVAENYGFSGRSCVLRSICESAHLPFDYSNGILGELFHVIMTPSLTTEEIVYHQDNEYHYAEQLGRNGAPCDRIFSDCKLSLLDQFSRIYSIID